MTELEFEREIAPARPPVETQSSVNAPVLERRIRVMRQAMPVHLRRQSALVRSGVANAAAECEAPARFRVAPVVAASHLER